MLPITEIGVAAGSIATTGGLLYSAYKFVVRPTHRFIRSVRQFVAQHQQIFMIVQKELRPNAGSSLRDVVHRIDDQLTRLESRGQTIVRHSKMPVWETDAAGRYLYVSNDFAAMLHRLPEDMYGHGWLNAVCPDDRVNVEDAWFDAIRQRRDFLHEITYVRPDGSPVRCKVEAFTMRKHSGDILGYVGMSTAIPPEE